MANVKTVSFGGPNADLQAQEQDLQRRQMMIDALRKQAMTPLEQQTVSGRVVRTSPVEALSKLAQMGASMYAEKKTGQQAMELGNEKARRSAEALRSLAPAGMFDDAAPSNRPNGVTPMNEAPAPFDPNAPQQAPQASANPEMKERWTRALKMMEQNPELGQKMLQNLTDMTTEQKDMQAQGIDPKLFGAAKLAKERAGGMVNVAPNSTLYNAGTNAPQFAGPDFNSGRNNTFGPNGQPQVSRMQGAEVIPAMAGEIKGAEAAAQATQDMVQVDTPQGPRMMTRAQAVQMSGGGQPAAAAPANPGTFTASNGVVINVANTPPDQLLAAAKASGDPRDLQAVQEYAQRQSQQGAPAAPAGPGIALQTPAQKESELGAVKVKNSVDEALAKQFPQELKDKQNALAKGETAIALIDKAIKHPGMQAATGLRSVIDPRNYIPGTDAKDFQVVMDQLGGQTFLQAMESLRGTGQITEIEGKKASDAIARLNRAQSKGEFTSALIDFKQSISGAMERARNTKTGIDVAREKLDSMPGALSPDDLVKRYLKPGGQ